MSGRIFITGGASGLGRAIAERYARAGWRVCIADLNDARGAETVKAMSGARAAEYRRCDVTSEEDLSSAARWLDETWGGVDVVVNNAGVALAGGIDQVSLDDWRWIIDINLLGVVRGCKIFTPMFKRQGKGHFVNVASMAGLLDVPLMSSYNATKAAVVSISETLQNELADDHIDVTVVCPSFFKTNLGESMRSADPGLHVTMEKLLQRSPITADDIAHQVFDAVEHKVFYLLPHREGRLVWRLKRSLPRSVYGALLRQQTRFMRASAEKNRHP